MSDKVCSELDCQGRVSARGLCNRHYIRARRIEGGKPLRERNIGKWGKTSKGYIARKVPDEVGVGWHIEMQHRVMMEEHLGRKLLSGEEVHHKNGVRDDNRMSNFELWSTKQPKGQRVEDKVEFALEILALYMPEAIVKSTGANAAPA